MRIPIAPWGMMMNYHPGVPIGEKGIAMFQKYRDRYVGSIAGESLGLLLPRCRDDASGDGQRQDAARNWSKRSRRSCSKRTREKYRKVFGKDLDANPYADVIACLSVGNIVFAPLCGRLGCANDRLRVVGDADVDRARHALGVHARRRPAACGI